MKITLAGLSPCDNLIIKHYFHLYTKGTNIQWEESIVGDTDAFIFRAKFFETPVIEEFLLSLPEQARVAGTFRNNELGEKNVLHGIHILDLSLHNKLLIQTWIKAIISGVGNVGTVCQSLGLKNEQEYFCEEKSNKDAFRNDSLLYSLYAGRTVVVFAGENVVLLNPRTNRAYTDYVSKEVLPFDQISWKEGSIDSNFSQTFDLKQWLWESLWNSTINFGPFVEDSQYYSLRRWPQPCMKINRAEPLRLAALAQRKSANTQDLAAISGYSPELIKKWLYSMQLVGFVEKKGSPEGRNSLLTYPPKKEEPKMLLNIFKKLRIKLHLA